MNITLLIKDYKIQIVYDIVIVTVNILVATNRDAKPFWDVLESKAILEWDKVIIDISACTFIDSTFMGIIVRVFKRITGNNGKLTLVYPKTKALLYLHTIGITKFVDCYNTLRPAINSFDSEIPTRKISFESTSQL